MTVGSQFGEYRPELRYWQLRYVHVTSLGLDLDVSAKLVPYPVSGNEGSAL